MNFANLPGQLIAIFIGWIFTLWLQGKANTKSEAIRKKDKIIDRLDKIVDWAEKNIPFKEEDSAHVEEIYSAMVSQVEIRTQNLYALMRISEAPFGAISELRTVDILGDNTHNKTIKQLRIAAIELIEDLELACDSKYFSKKSVLEKLKQVIYEMCGIVVGSAALIALIVLFILIDMFVQL